MSFILFLLFFGISDLSYGQQTIIYAKRGETADLCDDRPTSIFAYTYRSFDGKRTSILEPLKHERYSNPYQTSLLRITNVTESDSGLYKCPQDDTEWQKLQVYGKCPKIKQTSLTKTKKPNERPYQITVM